MCVWEPSSLPGKFVWAFLILYSLVTFLSGIALALQCQAWGWVGKAVPGHTIRGAAQARCLCCVPSASWPAPHMVSNGNGSSDSVPWF